MTLIKLIVFLVWYGQPYAIKPVPAVVIQITSQFLPQVFQNLMLFDVVRIFFSLFGVAIALPRAAKPLDWIFGPADGYIIATQ